MADSKQLKDCELKKVSGGSNSELAGRQVYGTKKIGYCKYCDAEKLLEYVGAQTGFVQKLSMGLCNKWRCPDCQCDNYYQQSSGILLP